MPTPDRMAELTALNWPDGRPKIAPVQGYAPGIPWSLHLKAYAVYCKKWGTQEALIDLAGRGCRGGFSDGELDEFVPGWRDEVSEIGRLRAEIVRLEALVYVPGVWRCAKCDFRLIQSNLNANTGTITARDTPGDKCPNCNSPLWRVTERQERTEAMELAETGFIRAGKAEDALADLADAADAVGIRFFDTDTMEPEVEAMQKATLAAREVLESKPRGASAPATA